MICPRCGGYQQVDLGDGRFRCTSQTVERLVPPGVAGNHASVAAPIYMTCDYIYDAVEATRADEGRRARADHLAEMGRFTADRRALNEDPATRQRIATLAAELIRTRPHDAVPVVVHVEIPSLLPFLPNRSAYAEVYRAWPIGEHRWMAYRDGTATGQHAVTSDGRFVAITDHRPSVRLDAKMRWRDPARDTPMFVDDSTPWASVLWRLEAGHRAHTSPVDSNRSGVHSALVGRPLSAHDRRQLDRLKDRAFTLSTRHTRLVELYGTERHPSHMGSPDRRTRRAWNEQAKLQLEWRSVQERIKTIKGIDDPIGDLGT